MNVTSGHVIGVRYRLDRSATANRFGEAADRGLQAPDRAHRGFRSDHDLGLLDTHVFGSRGLNELRAQYARRHFSLDSLECPQCVSEDRPGIRLGPHPAVPNSLTEARWQVADAFTWIVAGPGRHAPFHAARERRERRQGHGRLLGT